MKKIYTNKWFVLIIVSLILLLPACAGPKAVTAGLPEGMSSAMVPDMPLDAYLYVRQSQPTLIPGGFLGLPSDAAIRSLEAWAVPSGSSESVGAVVTLSGEREAAALLARIPDRADLWKLLSGSNIYLVWGSGSGAESLKSAAQARKFVPLKDVDKDAWDLLGRLPGPPAARPLAAGFVRTEERLINLLEKSSEGGSSESAASALKLAKIKMAAAAFYSERDLGIADFFSPANLRGANPGAIVVARSSLPGVVISGALGQAAPRLNIEKTEIDGRTAYYTAVDAPTGDKVHIFFNNSGSYVYAQASGDLERSKQLFRWTGK